MREGSQAVRSVNTYYSRYNFPFFINYQNIYIVYKSISLMKKRKQIGQIVTIPKFVKKEYISRKKKHATFLLIEIYSDSRYGAIARLYERNSIFDRCQERTTKKQRKAFSDSMKDIGKNKNKRVDTSKWVKPDEKTIKNALVESLFALEIFKEDATKYGFYYGKAQAFYSLLHEHSPKNPQTLSNWSIDPYFKTIMNELKAPVVLRWWKKFNNEFKLDSNGRKVKKTDWVKRKKTYQIWRKNCLKNMILKDRKPHSFKNIFKEFQKKKPNEKKNRNNKKR